MEKAQQLIKKIKSYIKLVGFSWTTVFIILIISPSFIPLMRSGYFFMQDDLQAFRIHQMHECFKDFQIPCRWVPDAGYQYGYPQFNFYPPSVYYIGELIHLLGFQFIDSVKILFMLGYILSALTMFILVKEIAGKWEGIVAAIFYTYIPYKAVEVYVRGALSEFWALVFFPLIFWSSYKLIKTNKNKYLVWLSLSVGLLLMTHSLMSLIFVIPSLFWVLYWLFTEKKWKDVFPKIVLSGVLGFCFASYFVLPAILEQKYVHIETMLMGYFDYRKHFVNLYDMFISREWGYGSSGFPDELLNLSTGNIHWLFAIIVGIVALFKINKNRKLSLLLLLLLGLEVFTLFLMHLRSMFIWERLHFLAWLQFPWRFMAVSIFLLPIIAGVGISMFGGFKKYIIGIIIIILAILLNIGFFRVKEWYYISDADKFSGNLWEKQLTISIFDYLPKSADLPPIEKAPEKPEILEGNAEIGSYKKGSNYQMGPINVSEDALIRAPIYDFPGMTVYSDGEVIDHINDDCREQEFCLGLVTFELPPGNHNVEIRLEDTTAQTVGNILSLGSMIMLTFIYYKKRET